MLYFHNKALEILRTFEKNESRISLELLLDYVINRKKMIPKETVDLIFETARIEEVVNDFVPLKKKRCEFYWQLPFP